MSNLVNLWKDFKEHLDIQSLYEEPIDTSWVEVLELKLKHIDEIIEARSPVLIRDDSIPIRQFLSTPVKAISEKNKWSAYNERNGLTCPFCHQQMIFDFSIMFQGEISAWSLQVEKPSIVTAWKSK